MRVFSKPRSSVSRQQGGDTPRWWQRVGASPCLPYAVIALVAIMQYTVRWGFAVPCGDEAHLLRRALESLQAGRLARDPYIASYQVIFLLFTRDPVQAHFILRFALSLGSALLLYELLRRVPWIDSTLACLLCAVWWVRSYLNSPTLQFGNVNLFCLTLVLPGVCAVTRKVTFGRCLFLAGSLLLVAMSRIEFLAPAVLWLALSPFLLRLEGRMLPSPWRARHTAAACAFAAVVLAFGMSWWSSARSGRNLNEYLMLGLNQCYAFMVVESNPQLTINPMQEYHLITDEVFRGAQTFTQALIHNPGAVLTYLALNSFQNAVLLLPSLLDHRSVIPYIASVRLRRLESVAFVLVALVGILAAVRRRGQGDETASERVAASSESSVSGGRRASDRLSRGLSRLARSGLAAPILLCSASSVSLMLHLPDARYWISCVPLLYMALAFGWYQAMRVDRARAPLTVAASLIILLCLSPFPVSAFGNGAIIRHLRQKWAFYESPKVAGSSPLAFYAYGTVVQPVALSDLTPEAIAARSIDIIVVDASLRQSATWQGAEGFWTGFEEDPERFGYAQAATQSGGDRISVYVRIPFELMRRPAPQPGAVPPSP